jgi:hypothetical protein
MRFIVVAVLLLTFAFSIAAQDPPPPVKEYNPTAWKEFISNEGRFSVSLPGTPTREDRTMDSPLGPLTTRSLVLQTEMAIYYLAYVEFPQLGPLSPADQ